jgi:hypothetical protein
VQEAAGLFADFFPLSRVRPPQATFSLSGRCRGRVKSRFLVFHQANELVTLVNSLNGGSTTHDVSRTKRCVTSTNPKTTAAHARAHGLFLAESARVLRSRRKAAAQLQISTGVQATAKLCKVELGSYDRAQGICRQVSLQAELIAEPADPRCAPALAKLPPDLVDFLSDENNVVDAEFKSQALFDEIEDKYAFVGGSQQEYINYLGRPESRFLWKWDLASKCTCLLRDFCRLEEG